MHLLDPLSIPVAEVRKGRALRPLDAPGEDPFSSRAPTDPGGPWLLGTSLWSPSSSHGLSVCLCPDFPFLRASVIALGAHPN